MPYSRNWLSQLWDDSTVTVEKFKEVLEEGRPSEVDDSSIGAETGGFHPELLHSISFSGGAGLILILAFMYFMYRRCNSCGCKDQVQQQHQPQQPDLHLQQLAPAAYPLPPLNQPPLPLSPSAPALYPLHHQPTQLAIDVDSSREIIIAVNELNNQIRELKAQSSRYSLT